MQGMNLNITVVVFKHHPALTESWNDRLYFLCLAIPEDAVKADSEEDDKANPDERLPQSVTDKRIAPDNEFSDSDDEAERKDQQKVFKSRKRPRLDKSHKHDPEEKKANAEEEDKKSSEFNCRLFDNQTF